MKIQIFQLGTVVTCEPCMKEHRGVLINKPQKQIFRGVLHNIRLLTAKIY